MKQETWQWLTGMVAALATAGAAAQAFPAKAVRLVVPFPPGGATDTFSRVAAAEMGKTLGQQVLVENRPGAGTTIAAELVAKGGGPNVANSSRDGRLERCRDLFQPKKFTPAGLEVWDPPGLPPGSAEADKEKRTRLLSALREADGYVAGEGMPKFLQLIREAATARLSDVERTQLAALLEPIPIEQPPAVIDRPLVRRFIARHRLEKRDPGARVSDPVRPIVYYLDPGVPEPVRSALLDGARWWNQAFEAAG